jgi:glycosyltransferase involved in cell wall biosynthesis
VNALRNDGQRRVLILNENEPVPHDRRVWDIARTLRDHDFDVNVVCPRGEGDEAAPFDLRAGVRIHRYPPSFASGGPASYVREYGSALWHISLRTRRLGKTRPFDLVHVCNPPDLLVLAALGERRRGAAVVFDHHDLVPELYLSRFRRRRDAFYRLTRVVEAIAYSVADVVIATNDSYRDVALRRGRKQPEDVFVVRNAPDSTRFRRGAPDDALRRGKQHLIAYVGVMGPQDGADHALRSLSLLRRRRDDWHALFLGDGDSLPDLKRLARDLGLDDVVEFTGWARDDKILRVLSTADLCLAPEPSSPLNDVSTMVKLTEYMAMERPIVSFDLPESRVSARDAAVYVPSADEVAFASAISELLDDPERRARMGAAGRERIERGLSWDASTERLLAAYDRAFEKAERRRRRTN